MKLKSKYLGLAALAAGLCTAATSQAAIDTTWNAGDLMLGFQVEGSSQILMVNLGATTLYRDATGNIMNIANISTQLIALGGATWYENTDLYFGLAGMRSSTNLNDSGSNTGAAGLSDPNRTAYFSKSRLGVGTVGTSNSGSFTATASNAGGIVTMGTTFDGVDVNGVYAGANQTNLWQTFNPFSAPDTQGTAFTGMPGGIQQNFATGSFGSFGAAGNVEGALDLWRDSSFANAGVTEFLPVGTETYQGSFVIDSAGNVSYIAAVPEPSSAMLIGSATLLGAFIRRRKRA